MYVSFNSDKLCYQRCILKLSYSLHITSNSICYLTATPANFALLTNLTHIHFTAPLSNIFYRPNSNNCQNILQNRTNKYSISTWTYAYVILDHRYRCNSFGFILNLLKAQFRCEITAGFQLLLSLSKETKQWPHTNNNYI